MVFMKITDSYIYIYIYIYILCTFSCRLCDLATLIVFMKITSTLGSSGRSGQTVVAQVLCPLSCLASSSCTFWCAWFVTLGVAQGHLLMWLARCCWCCSCTCWCDWLVTLGVAQGHLLMCLARYSWRCSGALVDVIGSLLLLGSMFRAISQHSWCLWRFVLAI